MAIFERNKLLKSNKNVLLNAQCVSLKNLISQKIAQKQKLYNTFYDFTVYILYGSIKLDFKVDVFSYKYLFN